MKSRSKSENVDKTFPKEDLNFTGIHFKFDLTNKLVQLEPKFNCKFKAILCIELDPDFFLSDLRLREN